MKTSQLVLVLALLGYCITQETVDQCQERFNTILNDKCVAINSGICVYDIGSQKCFSTSACSEGDGDEPKCKKLIHPDYHNKKCKYNTENNRCEEAQKECGDYGKATPYITDTTDSNFRETYGDVCEKLSAGDNKKRCILSNSGVCEAHYKDCSDASEGECPNNIPEADTKKCVWDTLEGSTEPTCNPVTKTCGEYLFNPSKEVCSSLDLSSSEDPPIKACIYTGSGCKEEYISCDNAEYNADSIYCEPSGEKHIPIILGTKEYDYTKICFWDNSLTTHKCQSRFRKCNEYRNLPGSSPQVCSSLEVTDSTKKRCAYKENGNCYEEYASCQAYTEIEIEKTRSACQSIQLADPNKECVYIKEEDICMERTIYTSCEAYPDDDKKICESILSPTTNSYCVLDKDSKCKERTFYCSDTIDEYDCLHYAKAVDENKRCAYENGKCYEEYKRCEDYTKDVSTECINIKLYTQKKCEFESDKCISTNKKCSDATTKEECKFIAETGVDVPDKKVCDFGYRYYASISSSGTPTYGQDSTETCFENYKFCSDYRGDGPNICRQIKPYNKEGTEIDITSKCEYESNVGCQRVPKDCSDANGNPILCAKISPLIKDHNVKYCAYIDNNCVGHFKSCESYNTYVESISRTTCEGIVPENYLTGTCEYKYDTNLKKHQCTTKKDCNLFAPASLQTLCEEINLSCTFSFLDNTCSSNEKDYSSIKFYKESEENEATCKSFELSDPNKYCSLKEDKTGCESIDREPKYTYDSSSYSEQNQQSSSQFIAKRINLFLILLCLLL